MKKLILSMLLILVSINNAYAAGSNSTDGQWEFSLAPLFLWGQGIEGDSQIGPTTAPLDVEFSDALDNLEAAFTIHYEMKRDALTLFAEYQFVSLGPEAEGPGNITLDVGFDNTIAELGAAYWIYGTERTNWELLGGARYTKQELDVAIDKGPDLVTVEEDWWVGFFGGRFSAQFSPQWTFNGRADFGVGSGESNRIWNLFGTFDYRFNDWGSVFIGYKWMDYDYENDSKGLKNYAYDASQQGPLAGLKFYW